MNELKNVFYGRTYLYPTPLDDDRQIGVVRAVGDVWIVAWFTEIGSMRRLKSPELQPSANPEVLQVQLDAWAARKGLVPLDSEVRS